MPKNFRLCNKICYLIKEILKTYLTHYNNHNKLSKIKVKNSNNPSLLEIICNKIFNSLLLQFKH